MLAVLLNAWRNARRSRKSATGYQHCLTFRIDGVCFGIDTRVVTRIAPWGILAIPNDKPGCVRGFLRQESGMIPVLDIAACYGNGPLQPGKRSCLVMLGLGHGKKWRNVGLMVDEVFGVQKFGPAELLPVPQAAQHLMQVGIVAGQVRRQHDYLTVLDAQRLMTDEEMTALTDYMRKTWPQAGAATEKLGTG